MAVADRVDGGEQLAYAWQLMVKLGDLAHYRRLAKAAMREWGQPSEVTETVLHGVTELLSNVARHTDDPLCILEITKSGPSIYVTVYDRSPDMPIVTLPEWSAESGRGLWLLREIAADFGYAPDPGGKRVWVRVDTGAVRAPCGPQL
ncbi:ATP-binding protein [Streptomyces gobiensis]|uniref:ATP-binding protein n=1 Tax=Streptomyces gobiensis TaxID=2875706 RepID=UPI001E5917AB|nr:ATP-binding protein [Streptomyces gobiensis]UGY91155.1 ATP-binding protein [Streptomyces gobiensis]